MKLKILGSGSSGNCYILENDVEALIIEAGVPFMEVKKSLNFNIRKIKAIIITHEHGDHRKYWYEYVRSGIPVFEPYRNDGYTLELKNSQFIIQAFDNRSKDGKWLHDNTDGTECHCYGYYIQHPDIGRLVYVTDSEYVRWRFQNVNHILVEANYSPVYMESIDNPKRSHILTGHMSIDTAVEFLRVNKSPALRNVVLLHLSQSNSDEAQFKAAAEAVVDCPVYVADKGLEVELRKFPF